MPESTRDDQPLSGMPPIVASDLVPRYRNLRMRLAALYHRILNEGFLRAPDLEAAAKNLSMFRDGKVVLVSPTGQEILYDHAVHAEAHRGATPLERALAAFGEQLEAVERALLGAAVDARLSAYRISKIEPGVGAWLEDGVVPDAPPCLLIDLALAETAQPGSLFVARILRIDGLSMTTGVTAPLVLQQAEQLIEAFAQLYGSRGIIPHDRPRAERKHGELILWQMAVIGELARLSMDKRSPRPVLAEIRDPEVERRAKRDRQNEARRRRKASR